MSVAPPKKPLSSKIVYQNPWITIHEDQTVDSNGNRGMYAYLESRNSVMVVVVNDGGAICLLESFRYPSTSFGWELPGGGGDGEDELTASKRELEEETGIIAKKWSLLGSAYVCNGLMSEKMDVLLATELSYEGNKDSGDDAHLIGEMRFFNDTEISDMIESGKINDCQTLAGLHYYQNYRRKHDIQPK